MGTNDSGIRRPRGLRLLALMMTIALGAGVATAPEATAAPTSDYGTLSSGDAVLPAENQCGTYSYTYDVRAPRGDWALETLVTDPAGRPVSSYTVLMNYSPGGANASTSYHLCRNSTLAGTFTLTGKLSVDNGAGNVTTYEYVPVTFQLTDPPVVAQPVKQTKAKHKHKHRKHKHKKRHR